MYEVFSCYKNGDLAKALEEAAGVVRDIGYDNNVLHVIARLDENVPDAWWVDVIYRQTQQSHNITGVSMASSRQRSWPDHNLSPLIQSLCVNPLRLTPDR